MDATETNPELKTKLEAFNLRLEAILYEADYRLNIVHIMQDSDNNNGTPTLEQAVALQHSREKVNNALAQEGIELLKLWRAHIQSLNQENNEDEAIITEDFQNEKQ